MEKKMIRDWRIPKEVTSKTMRDSLEKLAVELGIHLPQDEEE